MVSTMLLVFILFLCSITSAKENSECNIKAESAIISVADLVKNIEAIRIERIAPTDWCEVTGISSMQPTQNKNVETVRTNSSTTNRFFVTITELYVKCFLQLPENPAEVPSKLVSGMENAAKALCPPEKQKEVIKNMLNSPIPTMGLTDMLKLKACQPTMADVARNIDAIAGGKTKGGGVSGGISFGRKKRGLRFTKGYIHIKWKKVKASFKSVVKSGSKNMEIPFLEVLSKDYENIDVKCEEGSTNFARVCECVIATKFPVHLIVNSVYLILPCTVEKEANNYNDIIKYFDCDD